MPPPTSRDPGPRIIDGLELLAHILHPELFPEPDRQGARVDLWQAAPAA